MFPFLKRPLIEINARSIKIIGIVLIIISFMGWLIVLFKEKKRNGKGNAKKKNGKGDGSN